MNNPIGKEATIFLILIVTLSFVAGFATRGNLQILLNYNPTTQQIDACGKGWVTGGGATGNNLPGELLDQSEYIASWSPNLIGQRVTWIGAAVYTDHVPWNDVDIAITEVKTTIDITYPNGTILRIASLTTQGDSSKHDDGAWFQTNNGYWDILSPDGQRVIPEGTVITANLYAHIVEIRPWPFPPVDNGICQIASDQALIHTGIGSIWWDRDPALYEIGQTAVLNWQIGYVSDPQQHLGWRIYVTSLAQNSKTIVGPMELKTLTGTVSYKVTVADWAPFNGILTGYLTNELYSKDFSKAATIDNASLAPSLSITGISPQSPKQGQTVTISWTDAPNPITNAPIRYVEVDWGWGTPNNQVKTSSNATSYSFIASQSGFLKVAVAAWDTAGRPSGFRNFVINVQSQPPNLCLGSDAFCNPITNTNTGWQLLLFLLVLGFVLFGVGAYAPIPSWVARAILVAGGLVLVALSVYGLALYVVAWVKSLLPSMVIP